MSIFTNFVRSGSKGSAEPQPSAEATSEPHPVDDGRNIREARTQRRTRRTEVYSVRVRDDFKGEMLGLQAELQLERNRMKGRAKRVSEGELIELMLETFKVARRNGDAAGNAVPIANDVWHGVYAIARQLQISPAEVVEQLVVNRVAELGLVPLK